MSYRLQIPIRWADLDAQGHVNNVTLVDYTQEARARFLADGDTAGLLASGIMVVSQQVEYRRPVHFGSEPVVVEVSTLQIGGARFVLQFEVLQDGSSAALVRTTLCPFDFESQRPRLLTTVERDLLGEHLVAGEAWPLLPSAELDDTAPSTPVWARWSDGDPYGHVNNVATLEWTQEARIAVMMALDPGMARIGADAQDMEALQHLWLVVRQDIVYLKQLYWRLEPWLVRVAPVRIGNSSLTVEADVIDPASGEVYARMVNVSVYADNRGRPVALEPSARAAMEAVLVDPGSATLRS